MFTTLTCTNLRFQFLKSVWFGKKSQQRNFVPNPRTTTVPFTSHCEHFDLASVANNGRAPLGRGSAVTLCYCGGGFTL